jgi:hypothetical protein
MWNLASFHLETMSVLMQELAWFARYVPLGDEAQVEACFGPFWASANVDER